MTLAFGSANPDFSVHNANFLVESGNGGILGSKLSNGE
jgi:hypothetical protein